MSRLSSFCISCVLLAVLAASATRCRGAEMRLRAECSTENAIITLGDLVDLRCDSTVEAERLARISLFPAPAAGMRRFVSRREIEDMLLIRGIDLIDHEFRGAQSVLVVGKEPRRETSAVVRVTSASPRLADKRLSDALSEYLARSSDEPWKISFQLDEDTAKWIAAAQTLTVRGNEPPAAGRQCFEVTLQVADKTKTVDVVADVSLAPLVAVPARPIARGTRLDEADLVLQRVDESMATAGCIRRIEDLVGKEATRALAPRKPISRDSVAEPILVRRGDVVTVIVRSPGFRVRTQARARDDGAQGELVAVESLPDRRTYFAQVSGIREVEVLATPVSVNAPKTNPNQG